MPPLASGTPPRGARALQMHALEPAPMHASEPSPLHASEPANEPMIDATDLVIDEIDVDFDDLDGPPSVAPLDEPETEYDEIILDLRSPDLQDGWYA